VASCYCSPCFIPGCCSSNRTGHDLALTNSQAAKAAAQIATSDDADTIRKAAFRFDELYWGELVLVEDAALEKAMIDFRGMIETQDTRELRIEELVTKKIDRDALRSGALEISLAGFNLLQPNWFDQIKSFFRRPQKGVVG
jgi:hypothetical protein